MSDIAQKAQKIASALYLITGFFDEKEPLKWRVRSLSADLVSEIVKDKKTIIKELIALFYVAKSANLISDANHNILIKELVKLEEDVDKPVSTAFFRETSQSEKTSFEHAVPGNLIKDKNSSQELLKEAPREVSVIGSHSAKKNSRQSIILELLKRKREIMIKDVSALVNGVSEKTIQRELLAMVAAGVLRKIGEKRWSRYVLIGN